MWNPKSRTRVQVEENKYKIFPKRAPIGYKKPDGTFGEIDLTFNDTTSSIGDISLMDKGIVSVGKRKGNNPHKVVGIRPDKNQHLGTQQLEYSLVNVEIDGESQSFNVETDLEINLEDTKVFQLVKLNPSSSSFSDCKIEFDIHNTGLNLRNSKYTTTTTIRDYGFNLNNLGEIEAGTTDVTKDNMFTEDKSIPYLDCYAFKITDEFISTGEYSIEEEFGSDDLSNYTLKEVYSAGSSVYNKDNIIFMVKAYNIENYIDIITNQLCDIYGLEYFDDGGNGQYLTKNNKKVMGLHSNNDILSVFINTTAIPNNIKSLFKRKTFDDTSYLDITLSDFCTSITGRLNKDFKMEVDNTYYQPVGGIFEFTINNEPLYILEPIAFDENYNNLGYYTTHTLKDNADGSYRYTKLLLPQSSLNINTAKYLDTALQVGTGLDEVIFTTFQQIRSGHLGWDQHTWGPQYGDYNLDMARRVGGGNVSFAGSGTISSSGIGDSISSNKTANLTANAPNDTTYTQVGAFMVGTQRIYSSITILNNTNYQSQQLFYQAHYHFDTSGISDTIDTLQFKFKGGFNDDRGMGYSIATPSNRRKASCGMYPLKSTADTSLFSTASFGGAAVSQLNFNAYEGHSRTMWSASDATNYGDVHYVNSSSGYFANHRLQSPNNNSLEDWTFATASYIQETIALNSTAKTDVKNDNDFKICFVEHDEFLQNQRDETYLVGQNSGQSLPHNPIQSGSRTVMCMQVTHNVPENRPHLEYTTAAVASGYGNDVVGVVTGNIGKIIGTATANVGKVIGTD